MKIKGYTLVEFIITVAIVGILASVAIPPFLEFLRSGWL